MKVTCSISAQRIPVHACTSFYSQGLLREIPFPLLSVNGLAVHQLLMLQTCGSHHSGNILCGLSMPAAEQFKPHLVPTIPVWLFMLHVCEHVLECVCMPAPRLTLFTVIMHAEKFTAIYRAMGQRLVDQIQFFMNCELRFTEVFNMKVGKHSSK